MLRALVKSFGYSKVVICILTLLLSVQCANFGKKGVTSDNLVRPLKSLRKAVYYGLQNKVKNKSQNGRTYFSEHHRPGTNLNVSAYKHPERAQVIVSILGDRRPYQILVIYKIDKLRGGKYSLSRYDKSLAKKYLERMEAYLASRPEERDIIDDFRPY